MTVVTDAAARGDKVVPIFPGSPADRSAEHARVARALTPKGFSRCPTTPTTLKIQPPYDAFFALHHGLPRQGPGSDATTLQLLSLAGPLPGSARARPGLRSRPCRAAARRRGGRRGDGRRSARAVPGRLPRPPRPAGSRVITTLADMAELRFPTGRSTWCGPRVRPTASATTRRSAVAAPARTGRRPGRHRVRVDDAEPLPQARAFWERPRVRTTEANTAAPAAGYHVLGVHPQPESDWAEYYGPLGDAPTGGSGRTGMPEALAATRCGDHDARRARPEYGFDRFPPRRDDGAWGPGRFRGPRCRWA